jgi:hypothetical protein
VNYVGQRESKGERDRVCVCVCVCGSDVFGSVVGPCSCLRFGNEHLTSIEMLLSMLRAAVAAGAVPFQISCVDYLL